MIRAIAAIDDAKGIASGGRIPWDIPEDLQYFRQQTEGAIVLMGRKTAELLTVPLVNRRNIIVSKTLTTPSAGFELLHDVSDLLEYSKVHNENVWIIGGAQLYEATLDQCDEVYLTHVKGNFMCDRFFPAYQTQFKLRSKSPEQKRGIYAFSFAVYSR